MSIQAINFPKKKFTTEKARTWLKKNKHKPIKRVHETPNYYRYRLMNPKKFKSYRIKELSSGVKLVLGFS